MGLSLTDWLDSANFTASERLRHHDVNGLHSQSESRYADDLEGIDKTRLMISRSPHSRLTLEGVKGWNTSGSGCCWKIGGIREG